MSELPLNQILCGNCVEVLAGFPENSIDLVVTDPPYGLNFMGKDWDKVLPPREAFDEIIRVLKPGALAFVMSSPRQDLMARMIILLEDAGFNTRLSYIDWIYKTGFPKAYDVSKGIDKRKGGVIDRSSLGKFIQKYRELAGLTRHDASELVTGNRTGAFWNWENNYCVPNPELWPKIKEAIKAPSSDWDKKLSRAKREIIGESDNHISWFDDEQTFDITKPALDASIKWAGWKSQTGLKPAHEPILMVNKPFTESTIVDNVLKWGTGAINVEACRIPFQSEDDKAKTTVGFKEFLNPANGWNANTIERTEYNPPSKGRFPANLLVSDKALDTGKLTKSGEFKPHHKIAEDENGHSLRNVYGKYGHVPAENQIFHRDVGDQSRYFDLDAWAKHHGFLDVPKPDTSERDFGLKGKKRIPTSKFNLSDGKNPIRLDGAISNPRRNIHPTVKPIKLMAYLIELGCPPNGVVLDPFVGSGTTCIAAKQLMRKFIGIEVDPEYHALAKARVVAHPVPLPWLMGTETVDVLVPPIRRQEDGT